MISLRARRQTGFASPLKRHAHFASKVKGKPFSGEAISLETFSVHTFSALAALLLITLRAYPSRARVPIEVVGP